METNIIIQGDCLEKLKELPDNSVDAIITDPPYGLAFMGKEWDTFNEYSQEKQTKPEEYKSLDRVRYYRPDGSPVFWNKPTYVPKEFKFIGENQLKKNELMENFFYYWAKECLRVLKHGGYLLSFGGTRTYHRMTCGIEDAGFEIRDCIMWIYGSGFPKSLNIGKQIDKMKGAIRDKTGEDQKFGRADSGIYQMNINGENKKKFDRYDKAKSDEAKEWEGWGTALKPACEPIVVARKPLSEKNVALNVLKWGTGGINIDESRIGTDELTGRNNKIGSNIYGGGKGFPPVKVEGNTIGRFPANIILDEESAKMLDEQSGESKSVVGVRRNKSGIFKDFGRELSSYGVGDIEVNYNDKGGASRFFYVAKASKSERNFGCEDFEDKVEFNFGFKNQKCLKCNGYHTAKSEGKKCECLEPEWVDLTPQNSIMKNNHPTVKPIKLMEYLIKLVSREGSIILDPFIGSGTTAIACLKTNRKFIGIEKEPDYVKIAEARIKPYLEQTKL